VIKVDIHEESVSMVNVQLLRYVGAGLAFLVASIHAFNPTLGFPRLVQHALLGALYDPRPLVFTLSGIAIFAGILLVFNGIARRRIYLLGMAMMVTYLGGYVVWHTLLDHGAFWPYIASQGHTDLGLVESVVLHLQQKPIELVSKTAELLLLIVLAVLYREDVDSEPTP
jgi:hypothetical protein